MMSNVKGWVPESGLKPFLGCVALFVSYDFDADDWNAIRVGIEGTLAESGNWFDYEFSGRTGKTEFRVAYDEAGSSVVYFEVSVPDAVAAKVEAAAEIVCRFDLTDRLSDRA
jgi:hypothetical protein